MGLQEEIQDIILARLIRELQPEEEKKFQLWLNENPKHRKEYEELSSIRRVVRWGERRELVNREEGWKQLVKKYQRRRNIRLFSMVAVAASIVLAIGMFYLFESSKEIVSIANNEPVREKTEVTLILSSGDSVNIKKSDVLDIHEQHLMIHTDSSGLCYLEDGVKETKELVYNELLVPKCGEYELTLSDGSHVFLNADSKLRYPVNFIGDCREVYLEGEACFDVSKDTLRPFVVHTAYSSVRVLGTCFNISSYAKEDKTIVTLVNGKVQVNVDGTLRLLHPNEQLLLNHETFDIKVKSVVAEDYIAWMRGLFRFNEMPLWQLMMKLERWYNVSYEFKDETLKNICFTGGFWKYDDVRLILKIIGELANVKMTMVDRKVIINKK